MVTNTSMNPVPIQQDRHVKANVSGTVNLDSTDSGNLSTIESDLGNLKFDTSGNLETTAQTASPGAVTGQCTNGGSSGWIITHGTENHPLCSGQDFYATDITASGMDDNMAIDFWTTETPSSSCWGAVSTAQTRTSST